MNKRTFLRNTVFLGIGSIASYSSNAGKTNYDFEPLTNEGDDVQFWKKIRKQYELPKDFINLENGYYCIQPKPVLEKYLQHIQTVNREGAHYMRTVQFDNKKIAAVRLAELSGVSADELIITRNTTESLDLVIGGLSWEKGDEAIMAEQDYGAMLDMFKQVAKRHGVVNRTISIPMNPKTDEEIVDLYEKAITPKTKLLMVCHLVNITGQIMPVRKICDMAHTKNVQVMVDGAHAFAHLNFKIPDLNCDYYGCSLHKWLSVPLGAGLLYMKKEHIGNLYPLFAESGKEENDILRLNHTGTHAVATDLTIPDAIDFYQKIGAARKELRLRYLQKYWTDKVRHFKNVIINTPEDTKRSCAIANVGIKEMKPSEQAEMLLKKYNVYTVAIDSAGVHGCRITPNVFTTTDELDVLVNAITEMAGNG